MEIGAEINKKIRSAIKAKLVELGAYVDEELPDYIMVMVANKKRQENMVADLGLFLGNNAEKFASWLHDLLNKLQAISSDKEEKKKSSETKKSSPHSSTESSSKSSEHRKRHSSGGQGDAVPAKARKMDSTSLVGTSSHTSGTGEKSKAGSSAGLAANAAAVKPQAASSVASHPARRVPDAEEEPLIQVQADTDEFSEELLLLEDEEELARRKAAVVGRRAQTRAVPVQAVRSTPREEPLGRPPTSSKPPSALRAPAAAGTKAWTEVLPTPKSASSSSSSQSSYASLQDRASAASRKRRAPTSVVGNVKKTEVEEDEEEQYDPFNPAVGSVASVVKVTARKSSVPAALQANKSLLLKAVSDAEKSILSKKSSGTPSQATIRPIPREGGDLRDRLSAAAIADVRSRLSAVAAATDTRSRLVAATASSGAGSASRPTLAVSASPDGRKRVVAASRLGERNVRARLSAAASHDVRVGGTRRGTVVDARSRLPPSSTGDVESRLQGGSVYAPSNQPNSAAANTAATRVPQLKTVTRTINVPEYIPTRKTVYVVRREEDEKTDAPDSRVVEVDEGQDSPAPRRESGESEAGEDGLQQQQQEEEEVEEYRPEEVHVAPVPEILTDDNLEDYSFIEDEPLESPPDTPSLPQEPRWQQPGTQKRLVQEKAKSADTKFIVTLDGVDFDEFEGRAMELEEDPSAADGDSMKDDLDQAKKTPPKIKPFSINLKDSDDEMEHESPLQQARSTERCRFWPACLNGNACEYHHPTQACKTFPNCKFGDKCLFIHPNCKFDARCTRPDCPYTHASRRNPISLKTPQVIAIPHPGIPMIVASAPQRQVPCRFFPNCTNLKCPFLHPKPCRFGGACLNKSNCPFFHPAVPSKDKLKWTASGAVAGKAV